jgi:anti-sigma B factor antagonist
MSLTLNTRQVDGCIIVEACGQIEAGEACVRFQEFAKRLISGGGQSFVIDLSGVSYIDSAGIGVLLSIYATLRIEGGDLKLKNVGAQVKEALTITNLIQIFDISDT